MRSIIAAVFVAACLLLSLPAAAHGYEKGDLHVRHPWAHATAPGVKVAAGYMEIRNTGREGDRLVGASTPYAERVELHAVARDAEVAKTREVKALDLPPRRRLILRPGASHLAMIGLKKPLVKGDRVPLILRFERAGDLQVEIEVQPADAKRPQH